MSTPRDPDSARHPGVLRTAAALLGESPAAITALLAVIGAAFFGLASLGARIAYDPLGVEPREVGLTSGTALAQSAIGVLASMVVVLVVEAVVFRAARAARGGLRSRWPGVGLRRSRWLGVGRRHPHGVGKQTYEIEVAPGVILVGSILGVLALTAIFVITQSIQARHSLEDGIRPKPIAGLPSLWRAEVAAIHSHGSPVSDLPRCALYLGEADGITILYDAQSARTLRIPSSDLTVETTRARDRC